jgi:formamidopyrimidine-DNA glycosylase
MPELPEVETTRRGIEPHVLHKTIRHIRVRQPHLRWPVPKSINTQFKDQQFHSIQRRGKYLLLRTDTWSMIIHLGMSGSLRVLPCETPLEKHDHVEIQFDDNNCLRLRDPRRFGAVLSTRQDPLEHELLINLGVEPLSGDLTAGYLYQLSRKRKTAIKNFIMDSHIVVGVGNIYASEALYLAGIHPLRKAGDISLARFEKLVTAIKKVLNNAIEAGGTTLRDFTNHQGEPGYFALKLHVYGKQHEPCEQCGKPITMKRIGQRSSFYCTHCQK